MYIVAIMLTVKGNRSHIVDWHREIHECMGLLWREADDEKPKLFKASGRTLLSYPLQWTFRVAADATLICRDDSSSEANYGQGYRNSRDLVWDDYVITGVSASNITTFIPFWETERKNMIFTRNFYCKTWNNILSLGWALI